MLLIILIFNQSPFLLRPTTTELKWPLDITGRGIWNFVHNAHKECTKPLTKGKLTTLAINRLTCLGSGMLANAARNAASLIIGSPNLYTYASYRMPRHVNLVKGLTILTKTRQPEF